MALAERAEEGWSRGEVVPTFADKCAMDKGGGEADADDDLPDGVCSCWHCSYTKSLGI